MEINIVPVGAGVSLSEYVARAIKVLENQPEVEYELTSMGTNIAGDLDRLLAIARAMHQAVIDSGIQRVVTTIKIDDRKDKPITLSSRLESVRKKLGEGS